MAEKQDKKQRQSIKRGKQRANRKKGFPIPKPQAQAQAQPPAPAQARAQVQTRVSAPVPAQAWGRTTVTLEATSNGCSNEVDVLVESLSKKKNKAHKTH
jgi:hypothetical protein